MLSGRGIDGELKIKFGEWSEKFWQSNSWGSPSEAKNFQAIYLANGEGSKGGGKSLSEMKGGDGKQVVSAESEGGDKVKKFFGICVGGSNANRNGCKENKNNESVVLVGDDPSINSSLTWEKLKEQDWGQTSLVLSGHSYEGLFNKGVWKNASQTGVNEFNPHKVVISLTSQRDRGRLGPVLCPLIPSKHRQRYRPNLGVWCKQHWAGGSETDDVSLSRFLGSKGAHDYFNNTIWDSYGSGWQVLALLKLLDLWSSKLTEIHFDGSMNVLSLRKDGFVLAALMSRTGNVISLNNDTGSGQMKSVSYRKGGMWTIQLCSESDNCDTQSSGLSVTVGENRLCISTVVCVNGPDIKTQYLSLKGKWNEIKGNPGAGALWGTVFGSGRGTDHLERLLIALLVACFKDVEKVSLTVQKPSKEGQLIFKLMEEKK